MMENVKRNWLVSSKLTWGIWRILTRAKIWSLMGCFWPNFIMFELKKVQRGYFWWHWILMQNWKENWLVVSKTTWRIWQIFVHRLKNSNFILESKMVELNPYKNWKQSDPPHAVLKTLFYLGNKWIAQLAKLFTRVLQNRYF